MLKRLELTGHSMITRMAQMETIANNLANISTKGYKRDNVFVNGVIEKLALRGQNSSSNRQFPYSTAIIDLSQGNLVGTNRPLDVAISGGGFFVVETPQGEAYTRDGRFILNAEGILTSVDGYAVLGEGGPIEINIQQYFPTQILINEKGEILIDGNLIDKLQILSPANPSDLVKAGGNLLKLADGSDSMRPEESATVKQGFLEDSNVNPLLEMVSMIEILEQFRIEEKVVRTQDEILDRAANQIGQVA
jgi:flagellar basal-body rod protein FlgG